MMMNYSPGYLALVLNHLNHFYFEDDGFRPWSDLQPVLFACIYDNDTIITLQKKNRHYRFP